MGLWRRALVVGLLLGCFGGEHPDAEEAEESKEAQEAPALDPGALASTALAGGEAGGALDPDAGDGAADLSLQR